MKFRSQIALVTGGGHRLGRAICLALAERGAAVVVHYRSAEAAAHQTALACRERLESRLAPWQRPDPPSLVLQADLTRPQEVEELLAAIRATYGRLDLLVHCVGLHHKTPVDLPPETLEAAFEEQLAVNLRAAASTIRRAVPLLRAGAPPGHGGAEENAVKAGEALPGAAGGPVAAAETSPDHHHAGGAVVTLTDALLRRPFPGYGPYHAAKSALEALTHTWAVELAPDIRVNAVAPGIVLPAETDSAESRRRWTRRIPLGRLGTPEELAEAVCFLLSARYVTGQVLAVDGGLSWAR